MDRPRGRLLFLPEGVSRTLLTASPLAAVAMFRRSGSPCFRLHPAGPSGHAIGLPQAVGDPRQVRLSSAGKGDAGSPLRALTTNLSSTRGSCGVHPAEVSALFEDAPFLSTGPPGRS